MKKILYTVYVAVLIVMGAATFIESAEGTAYVHQHIYGAWWFVVLWAVLAIVGAIYLVRSRERRIGVLAIHAALLIILGGALLTHLTGRSGKVHLRMGEQQHVALMEHCGREYYHRLAFGIELNDFQIIDDDEGNTIDYRSTFTIVPPGDTTSAPLTVSMNNIAQYGHLRFYQASYDYDGLGSTLIINRDPYGIPVTYCGYALLFISFIALCLRRTGSLRVWLACIAFTVAWCVYYFIIDGSWTQIPVLRHPLLIFHVIVIILAYALLLIQTILSAKALLLNDKLLMINDKLSSSDNKLSTINYQLSIKNCQLLRLALCLLSIGIFLGAIWANISWGNYWSWDSKETWALITLMIYAVPLHHRSLPVFRNATVFHAYMLCAFLTVLMTYFGVNYFLAGMHSYA